MCLNHTRCGVAFLIWAVIAYSETADVFMKSHAQVRARERRSVKADDKVFTDARSRTRRSHSTNTAITGFSVQEIRDMVNQHNILRTNTTPIAADMEKMIWHEYLAEMAQDWSATCQWAHGQPARSWTPWANIGQNLYLHSSHYDGVEATDLWWGEYVDYTYNSPSGTYLGLAANCTPGTQCGHYTQVVWHNSWAVGCGVKYCPTITGTSIAPAYIITCNYGPAGNFINSQLYASGASCSSCPSSRSSCSTGNPVAGLCDWSATCNGYTCANGGTMNTDACVCSCLGGFSGQFCNITTATTPTPAGPTTSPTTASTPPTTIPPAPTTIPPAPTTSPTTAGGGGAATLAPATTTQGRSSPVIADAVVLLAAYICCLVYLAV